MPLKYKKDSTTSLDILHKVCIILIKFLHKNLYSLQMCAYICKLYIMLFYIIYNFKE